MFLGCLSVCHIYPSVCLSYREYSEASTNDLIKFWRSKAHQAVTVAKAATSMLVCQSPYSSCEHAFMRTYVRTSIRPQKVF